MGCGRALTPLGCHFALSTIDSVFRRCDVPRSVSKGLPGVEIEDIHERIRELCARALTAEEPEVESLLAELRAALRQHAQLVRKMATRALSRSPKNSSLSKAAD